MNVKMMLFSLLLSCYHYYEYIVILFLFVL